MATTFESAGYIVNEPQSREDLTGFNWSKVPTLLVEMGFMSNPEEDNLLSKPEHQEKLAKTISKGLLNYFQR